MIRISVVEVGARGKLGNCCDTGAMLNINKLIPGARGLAPALVKRAASLELDWDTRQKSRFEDRKSVV